MCAVWMSGGGVQTLSPIAAVCCLKKSQKSERVSEKKKESNTKNTKNEDDVRDNEHNDI